MNSIKQYFTFKKIIIFLGVVFFILFLVGGCSFKSIDPQYYKFKRLCKEAKSAIYDEELYRIYQARYNKERYYDEKTQKEYLRQDFKTRNTKAVHISKDLSRFDNYLYYKEKLIYFYEDYWYDYSGLFLQGDEGMGWYWETDRALYCKDNVIETRR